MDAGALGGGAPGRARGVAARLTLTGSRAAVAALRRDGHACSCGGKPASSSAVTKRSTGWLDWICTRLAGTSISTVAAGSTSLMMAVTLRAQPPQVMLSICSFIGDLRGKGQEWSLPWWQGQAVRSA